MRNFLVPLAAAVLSATFLTVAPAQAQKVKTDYNSMAPFSDYNTYSFKPGYLLRGKDRELLSTNQILDNRIKNALRTQLTAKRLREVEESANPDLWITYYVGLKEKQEVWSTGGPSFAHGYGYGGWGSYWGHDWNQVMVNNWTEGTLVVDIVDNKRDTLVWRAYITAAVTGVNNAKKADKKVNGMVKKAFKKYPPKTSY